MDEQVHISQDEVRKLRDRLKTVSQEKSRLKFVSDILADVARVRGLENIVRHTLFTIMDAIGGLNVALYYTCDGDWYYSDVYQEPAKIDGIDNELVSAALSQRQFMESRPLKEDALQKSGDLLISSKNVWVFPLIAGEDLIGALEMKGIFFEYSEDIKGELQIVINYLSLVLSNEIVNSSKLKTAYDDLKHESQKLEMEVAERKAAEREKVKLEAKLRQSQKMEAMGTLAGGIAHDFNNILFPLIGYTEMLQQDYPHEQIVQDRAAKILISAFRARDLVKQILTFSRQSPQELQPVRVQSIVKECLKLLDASIPKTIDIETQIDPDCGLVIADPTEIHQIVMNLATNAYHAMQPSGGSLKISLRQVQIDSEPIDFLELSPGKYVLLKVVDTGHGIAKNVMDKIFDPYFTTKPKDRGTGLGLAVVQGIVKKCKGGVHVYSEPGQGTEIHVHLPLMVSEIQKKGVKDIPQPLEKGCERILLVDDEITVLDMEKMMLERLGYHVTPRKDSLEALETFNATPDAFDLVITDMTMPKMSGGELSVALTRIRPGIPILLCTGFSENMSKEKSQSLGIKGFLQKPMSMRMLAGKIREVLS